MAASIKTAWTAFEQGDAEKAESLFQTLTSNPNGTTFPWTQQGLFFLRLDRYQEAAASLQQAVERDPANPAPLFFLALAQELAGERENFWATLAKLAELSPHHQGRTSLKLLAELRGGDPLPLLRQFGFGPRDGVERPKFSQRVAASMGRGKPEWLPSELSSSDYLLGPILVEVETRLHALEVPKLEHHPPLLPEDLDSLKPVKRKFREEIANFGNSVRAGNALKKGRGLLEKAWAISDPEEQKKPLQEAVKYLRAARKTDPHAFRVSYHLAEAYILMSKNEAGKPYHRFRLLQAQTSCLASANNEGLNPYLLFYLAYIQHLLGRPKLAIEYYQAATDRFEKLPEAHYGRGQCHLLLGDATTARRLFLKAVNSDLALARERLDLFARILSEKGPDAFGAPLPTMTPEPPPTPEPVDPPTETALDEAAPE
ncbi:MAG: tetratricopeptide repeat protein [Vulcanimicrobiota bacterium]